jgi:type I restriction enzyme M protein
MNFSQKKLEFDLKYKNSNAFKAFLPIHLTFNKEVIIKNKQNQPNEEYYKWQFLYAIVYSGMYAKDYIGVEIHFPKGNKSSSDLILDCAIFDSKDWFSYYEKYHKEKDLDALQWLRNHLIAVVEFKKENSKDIQTIWDKQLKAYLKESERDFCLGAIYDTERLYLFKKEHNKFLRYNDGYNTKGEKSTSKDMQLHLTDSYLDLPNFDNLINWINPKKIDRSKRTINELDIISGVHSTQINDAMSAILRTMDKQSMVNQKGFEILIQILALKIYDEKYSKPYLNFYILDEELNYKDLTDENIQTFINRIKNLREKAKKVYFRIFQDSPLDTKNINHIKVLVEVVKQFQDYSFAKSHKTDLYQLVFYKFSTPFAKDSNAQFVTPLPIIDFLVSIVNPRNNESVIDPTVGIADFLSVSYVNSNSKLDDNNIFGLDIDEQMVMLATLNMLLNGDGNAKIKAKAGYGSILTKFDIENNLIDLIPSINKNGNWDERVDNKELKKFDVVLTNPPFGEDRAYEPKDDKDKEVIECYELWHKYNQNKIDLGVVFLENAYRILEENGRMGIVVSNSIASIDSHKIAREWLMDKMRIVAIFDLPPNVFAETGVNTSLIVAYKPSKEELEKLKKQNYEIFFRNIQKIGYEVKTKKRVKYFEPVYKIDYNTFDVLIDSEGKPVLDEEFSETIEEFKEWCKTQEETLQELFISEK